MIGMLLLIPTLAGAAAFGLRSDGPRRALLVLAALLHAVLTAACWLVPAPPAWNGWLQLDAVGLLFLSIASALFLAAALYAPGYLHRAVQSRRAEPAGLGLLPEVAPEAVFTGCLLLFLASMTLVTVSHHFGLLWVAVEATTLASAPLIYYHRQPRSLEATWKYLLICSVGIALALLGNFLLVVAATPPGAPAGPALTLGELLAAAPQFQTPWLKAAFLFLLVGYGTKMGLAPLHTWLPDAHSEAPSVVSALLSGALLNCAFLAILRAHQVCAAAGQAAFSQSLLVLFGLLSMGVAAVFIIGQPDYKRLLAYSSVEHMGLLALGVGLGGAAVFGALLHAVNHSLTKALLFFAAGNLLACYRSKRVADVHGALRALPVTGALWVLGLFAIVGSPPFGPFLSELTMLKAAFDQGRWAVGAGALALLALVFIGMSRPMLAMAQGAAPATADLDRARPGAERWFTILSPLVLAAAVLVLGLYLPPWLTAQLQRAAALIGGAP